MSPRKVHNACPTCGKTFADHSGPCDNAHAWFRAVGAAVDAGTEQIFLILSMQRTAYAKACVWWRPSANGYTTSLGEAGRYTLAEAWLHADPPHHLAIPLSKIEIPASRAKALAKLASPISRFDTGKDGAR